MIAGSPKATDVGVAFPAAVPVAQTGIPTSLIGHALERMQSHGTVFDNASLTHLRQRDEATQIAMLLKVQEFIRNPSSLLLHLLQTQKAAQNPEAAQPHASNSVQAHTQAKVSEPEAAVDTGILHPTSKLFISRPEQSEQTTCELGLEPLQHQSPVVFQTTDQPVLPENLQGQAHSHKGALPIFDQYPPMNSTSCPPFSMQGFGSMLKQAQTTTLETSGLPASQYLMSQHSLDNFRSIDVATGSMQGAAEPQEIEHAVSLCNSDLAYLTVCRVRDVESFPWKLPAGWYALHVAQRDLTEPLRRIVAGTGKPIPANLPTSCIVAVCKLGVSKPSMDFSGDPWALGAWCQAIEDVVLLQKCVPVLTEELRRLWVLPENIRAQVRAGIPAELHRKDHQPLETAGAASTVDPRVILAVSTPLRSTSVVVGVECHQMPDCKRARLRSLLHASFPQDAPPHLDRLQRLYAHPRDQDCHLDDKLHKYCVLGETYNLSVSGWWKMFFEDFDPKEMSERIVQRHLGVPGFRTLPSGESSESILASSVYNFAQHIRVLEGRGDDDCLNALQAVAQIAQHDYACRGVSCPFSMEHVMEVGRKFLLDPQKADGRSCYYLMLLYTASSGPEVQAAQIARTWEIHGNLESLKGTYMHKKIELFINAMARVMERDGTLYVPVEDLLREQPPAHEYSAEATMRQIAWAQESGLWNHPRAQDFFEKEMGGESLEFQKFRSWLSTKPRWTPFRLEWSLYNEDLRVAGQIDSLWLDLDKGGAPVMADWKRARALLTDDAQELEQQSFGKKGTDCCSHLHDTAWSHYFVQQTLYAYLLASKYGLEVRKMMLVQCHPHVCGPDYNEAPLVADFDLAETMARFLMSSRVATN